MPRSRGARRSDGGEHDRLSHLAAFQASDDPAIFQHGNGVVKCYVDVAVGVDDVLHPERFRGEEGRAEFAHLVFQFLGAFRGIGRRGDFAPEGGGDSAFDAVFEILLEHMSKEEWAMFGTEFIKIAWTDDMSREMKLRGLMDTLSRCLTVAAETTRVHVMMARF